MNMFEITQEYANLISEIEDADGEITPEVEERLKLTQENYDEKLDAYVKLIRNKDAEAKAYDAEIKRMQAAKKAAANLSDKLKEKVRESMLLFGIDKKTVGTFKLSFTNSTAVEITDDEAVPMEYKVAKYETSKTLIKDAIGEGKEVPGAQLVSRKNLQIK